MSSYHPSELDSVESSPRSDHGPQHDDAPPPPPRVRFMCSFGGKILPRPHDHQLRYVGGETRIVAVHRRTTFHSLLSKLSKLAAGNGAAASPAAVAVKYQLPNEDLDALISVTSDEDVENMMEEYDRISAAGHGGGSDGTGAAASKTPRLRLFLFPVSSGGGGGGDESSRASSISSLLDGSTRRDWFFDALNGGAAAAHAAALERGRSEGSSIVSEVPDYLFGLDNPDKSTRPSFHDNVSASDPGSPAPQVSSPFCSTSSGVPDLPPVKVKPESPLTKSREIRPSTVEDTGERVSSQQTGFGGNPMWHYDPNAHLPGHQMQPLPVYYVPGAVPPGNVQVHPIQVGAPYVQQYPGQAGHVPVGFHQAVPTFGGEMRVVAPPVDAYEMGGPRMLGEGVSQHLHYGRNGGMVPAFAGGRMPVFDDMQRAGSEQDVGRVARKST